MIAYLVRFKSRLSLEELLARSRERAPRYRELSGLLQKHYLRYADGEYGAVYFWESRQALEEFRSSELARTIPAVYQVQGPAEMTTGEVVMSLREESAPGSQE